MCPWAAARPLAVRAASFARRVVSKPGQAPPPPTGTAAWPSMMSHVALGSTGLPGTLHTCGAWPLCVPVGGSPPWPCRHPPAPRQGPSRHSLLSPQPISHVIPPQPFQTLNLERWNCNVFQPSLKRHPIELRATFVRAMSWHTPGTATKPSSSLPVRSTGIP